MAGGEQFGSDEAPGGDNVADAAVLEAIEQGDIGAPAGGDEAAIGEAEDEGGGVAGGAIDVMQRAAHGDEAADGAVEMAFLGDVERIAVIGAEGDEAGGVFVQHFGQRLEILGDRAFADQDGHALGEFFAGLGGAGGLVVGANGGSQIAVERSAEQQRRMPVDMATLERHELGDDARIGIEHAGEVHHFGEADDLGMGSERFEVMDFERCTGGFEGGGGDAGRQVDADVHHRLLGAIEEIFDALGAQHIGDFMGVADHGGDAVRQHAAVEFEGGDQGGFDVQVRVDEAGDGEAAVAINGDLAVVARMGADDAVGDDGNVGLGDRAGDHIEQSHILDDKVRRLFSLSGHDHAGEGGGVCHGVFLRFGHGRRSAASAAASRALTPRSEPAGVGHVWAAAQGERHAKDL